MLSRDLQCYSPAIRLQLIYVYYIVSCLRAILAFAPLSASHPLPLHFFIYNNRRQEELSSSTATRRQHECTIMLDKEGHGVSTIAGRLAASGTCVHTTMSARCVYSHINIANRNGYSSTAHVSALCCAVGCTCTVCAIIRARMT